MDQNEAEKAPSVPARAIQGVEARTWLWVEALIWTARMMSALVTASQKIFGSISGGHRPLRSSLAARLHSLADCQTLPIRELPTGEPYAGKPPVRFGGRGGVNPSRPLSERHTFTIGSHPFVAG